MKTIRYIGSILMIATGILHFLPSFQSDPDPNAIPMLLFGIGYLFIGILLFKDHRYGKILGVILPLIGLGAGFFILGIENWNALFSLMFLIDAIVICICLILIFKKTSSKIA
ncbi:hypothetical protein [uncultured Algoriphagus sp.]|uniref:hypothetical protein n=1 Tax=uncultured Algoriphagus sp. TaxID=417365 RepID=UPI002583D993|nr:hypothetical protein [uncultured Algoriphagus sp.]